MSTNTFKGTPGAWVFKSNMVSNDYETVASLYGFDKNEKRANGILISCAPDMLVMLIKLNSAIDTYNNDMTDDNLKEVNKTQRESLTLITRATTI